MGDHAHMKPATFDKLIWPAIFGGILLTGFGWSLPADEAAIGWSIIGVGLALVLSGLVMIGLRSRHDD